MPSYPIRSILAASVPLLIGASPVPPLSPGAWTFISTPVSASLDGRVLHDLPVGEITSETTCLTPAQATAPGPWLARDLLHDCTLDRASVAGGRVAITGHCPPPTPGFAAGTLRITGRYTAASYDLRFATVSPDQNGTMGFDGLMTGKRTGNCS
ncbi:DUF3617 domain-containing protein [Sphingomonas bacterium]|uniref:DUF3617 domain-containing protein n=1 Tax=Sphingomonas bacterium TaxID=1895847 RepID=UPI0015773940|nr:DUF3617 family protein [Sphingomonas bacterium]